MPADVQERFLEKARTARFNENPPEKKETAIKAER